MKKIRTIAGVVKALHEKDPGCAITEYCLRRLVKAGELPTRKSGAVYLLALEDVERYFEMPAS